MSETFVGAPGDGDRVRGFACAGQAGATKDSDCCDDGLTWARMMCNMICQLCCLTCTLGPFKVTAPKPGTTEDDGGTPAITPGTYPVITPVDGEISFTDSAYGAGLPIVFGSDLLDGNVFWRSEFVKNTFEADGESYFYNTVSFALGICEGQINGVLRLFVGETLVLDNRADVDEDGVPVPRADGYVAGVSVDLTDPTSPLRNVTASKRATKITVFNGSTSQLPAGIMSETEGPDLSPGYRGVAYVLIENLLVEDSIPHIRAEITANTVNLYPRLYGSLNPDSPKLAGVVAEFIGYDPTYDMFYVYAENPGVGENRGFILLDGNTLEFVRETVVAGPDSDGIVPFVNIDQTHILTNGLLLIDAASGNAGEYYTFNPFSDLTVSGPLTGGGISGHSSNGLARTLSGSVTFRARGRKGLSIDILGAPGFSTSAAVGFAEINDDGSFVMGGYQNTVMGANNVRMVYYPVPTDTDITVFPDGAVTEGIHTYSFGWHDSEKEHFTVVRASLSETADASIASPVITVLPSIDFDLLGGVGVVHSIYRAFYSAVDQTLVLMIRVSGRDDRMIKFDPLTGAIVWNKSMPANFPSATQPDEAGQLIYGPIYMWLSSDNKIYQTDLADGTTAVAIDDFATQDLPTPVGGISYFNGYEGSITYLSATAGKEVVKVFCSKANRAQAQISTIVTQLLARVGWNNFSTTLDDLQALAIDGYTISSPTQLRSIFADLKQVFRFDIVESNGTILYKTRGAPATLTIDEDELGEDTSGWLKIVHDNDLVNTRKLNLTYRDLERDYKQNVQSIQLPNYTGQRIDNDSGIDVTVPIVLTANDAKKLAEILLYSKLVYETAYEGKLGPQYQTLDPGDVVTLMDDTQEVIVRMRDVTIGQDRSVDFIATKEDPDIYEDQVNLFGNVGRYEEDQFDPPVARIDPLLLDIPYRNAAEAASTNASYLLYLALLNFRVATVPDATLTLSVNGAASYGIPMPTTFPTWGYVTEPLDAHMSFASTDFHSTMRVKMMSTSGAVLDNAASLEDMIDNGQLNLAYVNGELIQFKNVVSEGSGIYAFSVFNRALRGTEPRSGNHAAGEKFVLLANNEGALDNTSVSRVSLPLGDSPRKALQIFVNTNNPFQPDPITYWLGLNLRPQIVAALEGYYQDDDMYIVWDYRARYGGEWPDDGDEGVSFTDGTEEYTIYLAKDPTTFDRGVPSTYYRRYVQNTPGLIYSLEQQLADGFDNLSDTMYVFITQSGSLTGKDPGAASTTIIYPQA